MSEAVQIVVVEDDPHDLEMTLRALRKANLANGVEIARDGAEALALLLGDTALRPRLVLLDLKLPKIDGLEVLARLKADERTRRIPIVVLTSSNEPRDLQGAYDRGVNSYIVKPVTFDQLASAVVQLGMYWCVLNAPS